MWDVQIANPLGRLSWRKLLTVALSVLVTVFAYLLLTAPAAHAAGDLQWQNGDIIYQNNTYKGPTQAKADDGHQLPEGTILYSRPELGIPQTIHVIYFAAGSDPSKATEALYTTYHLGPGGGLTDKSDSKKVTIDTGTQAQAQGRSSNQSGGTCNLDGNMGWIICPITNTLAIAMDWVFGVVSSFLEVRPLETTSDGAMMRLWNLMRNFANIAFVIAFVVIIYSQVTSWGISNYGIKKLLPRLVIAAILVNISYWICALAIDLSNITGYGLQSLLISLRENALDGMGTNGWQFVDWETLVTFILTGGAATAGATVAWSALALKLGAFSVTGVTLLALPVLLSAFLIILVVLFILAARQAIITLLVILAPLAFVAYILPNTEKWFERWRELFTTMLIFFPIFSLAFGGAQFAGLAIIHNASDISMVILGMAVQIAPLAITPLILKLSGSLLGRIAGIINNPSKGLIDRTRNWANDRIDANKAAQMQRTRQMAQDGNLKRRHVMRRTAMHLDNTRRMREGMKAIYEDDANTLYNESSEGFQLARAKQASELLKERSANEIKTKLQQEINLRGSELHIGNVKLEASKIEIDHENKRTTADIEEYKSGRVPVTGELAQAMNSMRDLTVQNAAETQRAQSATNMQQKMISNSFTSETLASQALLRVAAGVDPNGRVRAKANAEANLSKIDKEALDNSVQLLNIEAIKAGKTLKSYALDIVDKEITLKGSGSTETQVVEAALEAVAQDGQISILRKARMSDNIDQATLTKLFARNASTMKGKGGFDLQANPDLALVSAPEMNRSIAGTIGDVTASNISDVKAGFWADVANDIGMILRDASSDPKAMAGLQKTYTNVTEALRNDDIRATIGDRLDETVLIHKALHAQFSDSNKTIDYTKL